MSDERGGGGRGRGGKGGDRDKGKGGDAPRRGGFFRRRRVCKFCAEKIDYINYKDVRLLAPFLPERGKIQPRRISGTCALHQRKLQTAIKRARQLALVPYVTDRFELSLSLQGGVRTPPGGRLGRPTAVWGICAIR